MENLVIEIKGQDINKIEAIIDEMPYKFAAPLMAELQKHVKDISKLEEDDES